MDGYCTGGPWRCDVNKVIVCPCGFVLRADNEPELVTQAQKHATDAHDMELTEEQALAMARPE